MAIIKLVEDAYGTKQVLTVIQAIAEKAHQPGPHREKYQDLAKYVAQAFDILKSVGVPDPPELLFKTEDVRIPERTIAFRLLKPLKTKPLLEFRVNWQPEAFRAIFFYDERQGQQILFFVRALLKAEKNPPELQLAINETEQVYLDYLADPIKY